MNALSHLPFLSLCAVFLTIILLLIGWILSIRAGLKAIKIKKGTGLFCLFLTLPITNPLALIALLVRDFRAARPSIILYLVAFFSFPLLGMIAKKIEAGKMNDHIAMEKARGTWLEPSDLIPEPVPDSENIWEHPFLKAERVFYHSSIFPMRQMSLFEMQREMKLLGLIPDSEIADSLSFGEVCMWIMGNFFLSAHGQAFTIKDWIKGLQAYEAMIPIITDAEKRTKSEAWNQCEPSLDDLLETGGSFARGLLPVFENAFRKALDMQHRIELAKIAVALERHYLVHDSYPEELAGLVPNFLSAQPIDPMTGQNWKYIRLGNRGFRLYSLGKNGRDEGGIYDRSRQADDHNWKVAPSPPPLPRLKI